MDEILNRFVASTPVAVMAHTTLRRVFADGVLNDLFERHAKSQYTRDPTFSTTTKLMLQVTTRKRPSVHAAHRHSEESVPVSVTSVYNKSNALEPGISQALVREAAARLGEIVAVFPRPSKPPVAGSRLRTLDGNFLAGTDHRLDCLRDYGRGGVARDVAGGAWTVAVALLTDLIPCKNAYTNGRALVSEPLALAEADDLWLGDRNYCTNGCMAGLDVEQAVFVFRHHAATSIAAAKIHGLPRSRRRCGGLNAVPTDRLLDCSRKNVINDTLRGVGAWCRTVQRRNEKARPISGRAPVSWVRSRERLTKEAARGFAVPQRAMSPASLAIVSWVRA